MNAIGKIWSVCTDTMSRLNSWRHRRATMLHDSILRRLTRGRPPIGLPVLLIAALVAIAGSDPAAAADCFYYGETVTLSGQYFANVAPADDGVVRDALNDDARRVTLLKLAAPFCVDADGISGGVTAALTIQLNCPALHLTDGTELMVKGRLLGAHTGNGHTPVLLMCL
jgi:hypothetical protein